MSMYRQFWLAIILSTILALIGSLLASTLSSRAYLNEQLRLKNADNATVLALSLSQKNVDVVELELVIAALFDSGHYASIRVVDPAGKTMIERSAPAQKNEVPTWFVNIFPIQSEPGQAQISNGWKQIGTVSLATQAGSAYQTLWKSTREMVLALTISGLIAGYLGTMILRRLRKPLRVVIEQANAMTERRFIITPEPAVPELKQLSMAMNSTVSLLQSMFAEEAERVESLRRQANTDPVTGLSNRNHFMAQLQVSMETEDAPPGNLMLIRLTHLSDLNRQLGRDKADAVLRSIGDILAIWQNTLPEGLAARLNGTDFALMFRQTEAESVARSLLTQITKELSNLSNPPKVFMGFGQYSNTMSPGAILSQVDTAVASAEITGNNDWRAAAPLEIEQAPRSTEEWSKLIHRALEQRWVKLALFPVIYFDGKISHNESALRLMFGGEWFPAGRFLPIAERLGMTEQLDLAAVGLALDELASQNTVDIAVNLSAQSIQNAGFRSRLLALLHSRSSLVKRLWLEVPENGAFQNIDAFRAFHQDFHRVGCKLGLEHFGRHFEKINQIHDMKLDYLKIDGAFIREIDHNPGNQAFVKGIGSITHRMGLQVYAESVNSAVELETLATLGIDGATGSAVAQ